MSQDTSLAALPADSLILKSYLALGDSYTIGQSVPEMARFPLQTVSMLLHDNILFAPPEIIARTGWTTGNLLNAIDITPPQKLSYDVVSLLIGVNNQYQHLNPAQYKDEFTILLNKAIQLAGNKKNHVFVLSIPDYGVTPFANGLDTAEIAAEIDEFNAINKSITLTNGCSYIDITALSRLAASYPTLVAGDGLHPSGDEYNKWALLLSKAISLAL